MSQYTAPTELSGVSASKIEHMTQADWDKLVASRKRKFESEVLGKAPRYNVVAQEIPNRDPITLLEWVAAFVLVVGFLFTSTKVAAAAIPYAEGVLSVMTHGKGEVALPVRLFFTAVVALFFILLATPSVIFFKIVDHTPQTAKSKAETAIVIERWPANLQEWIVFPPYLVLNLLSLDWLTPRLPMVITYTSIGWLVYISVSGGGNLFEMAIPIFVEVGLAQTVASMLEKTAAYRSLVLDAWEQRMKRWKYRKQNYMADAKFLEDLFADIRDKLLNVVKNSTRPNAWLERADPQVVDDTILAEFRRFTGGQKFAERVQQLDYTKALVQGEALVPPNGAGEWTPDTLYRSLLQRNVTGSYGEAQLLADYGAQYKARSAWRGGARSQYEASRK